MSVQNFLLDKDKHLTYARRVANFLELKFSILKFKFGVDPILGLIPGLGDAITTALSFYLVYVAILHKIDLSKVLTMTFYILADLAIGSIPILGDILDFAIKPNIKNMQILETELGKRILVKNEIK